MYQPKRYWVQFDKVMTVPILGEYLSVFMDDVCAVIQSEVIFGGTMDAWNFYLSSIDHDVINLRMLEYPLESRVCISEILRKIDYTGRMTLLTDHDYCDKELTWRNKITDANRIYEYKLQVIELTAASRISLREI